jgi:hypothetical protein
MERKTSQFALAILAWRISFSGIGSSNQTTSGRNKPPQAGHFGGTSPVSFQAETIVPSSKHWCA